MPTYVLDTIRQGTRLPAPWVLLGVGALAGWSGLGLAVLALGESDTQAPAIVQGTAHLFGVLTVLWVLARLLEEDASARLAVAADCSRPGPAGRLLGRWLGAVLLATGVTVLLAAGLGLLAGSQVDTPIRLLSTSIEVVALVGAWGLLLAALVPGPVAVLGGGLLWFAGHLPWGGPDWLEGRPGSVLGALLPGPPPATQDATTLASAAAATVAVVLAALVLGATVGRRR